ncbi:hypothetical protein AGMMS50256_20390 [Betaproteobacteria bacterium]|nr:hypothetical protein AGMMS50256_20390 [Betaproteobacteria bacterium]
MDSTIFWEVQRMLFACWREVDINAGIHTHEFYEADGGFWLGDREFRNQEEIRRFYVWKRSGQPRTTRHLVLNPIMSYDQGMAIVDYTLVVFGGAGDPPISTAPPISIADVSAKLILHGDRWLFRQHRLAPVMHGQNSLRIPDELPA